MINLYPRQLLVRIGAACSLACMPATSQQRFAQVERSVWPDPSYYSGLNNAQAHDVDRDGDADIIYGRLLFRHLGSGAFASSTPLSSESVGSHYPSFGDVNGDGFQDIVLPHLNGPTWLLLGDANGGLTRDPLAIPALWETQQHLVSCLLDIDSDGDLDIVLSSTARPMTFLLNDGSGNFVHSPSRERPIIPGLPWSIQAAHLDGDIHMDFIVGMSGMAGGSGTPVYSATTVFLNDGAGNFRTGQRFLERFNGSDVSLGDVDLDGDTDLLIYARFTSLYTRPGLYINDGNANFIDESHRFGSPTRERGGKFADVDGDGDLDIVAGYHEGQAPPTGVPGRYAAFALWINDGTGHFTDAAASMPTIPIERLPYSANVHVGDFDGDGDVDLLTSSGGWGFPLHPDSVWNLTRHLYASGPGRPGTNYEVRLWADAGHAVALLFAFGQGHADLGSLGVLRIDPATMIAFPGVIMPTSRTVSYAFTIPTDPLWLGADLNWQALDVDPSDLSKTRLMAAYRDVVGP